MGERCGEGRWTGDYGVEGDFGAVAEGFGNGEEGFEGWEEGKRRGDVGCWVFEEGGHFLFGFLFFSFLKGGGGMDGLG